MSLFADYLKETRGTTMLEDEDSFVTYKIDLDECYIEDAYTRPSKRRSGKASGLVAPLIKLAKAAGCAYLTTTVNCKIKDPSTSMKAMLNYGFQIDKVTEDVIFLRMEI